MPHKQPSLPDAVLGMSDARLGRLLWDLYVDRQAALRGVGPDDIAEALRAAVAVFDADEVSDQHGIALAKALQRAACRRYSAAGRIFRALMLDGARIQWIGKQAQTGIKTHAERVRGGKMRAAKRVHNPRDTEILAEYQRLCRQDMRPAAARLIARRMKLTPSRVRQILRKMKAG